jgi:hypothetical protein
MELQQQQHCRFGLGLDRLLISYQGYSSLRFQFIITARQTINESHALRKCIPLAAIVKRPLRYDQRKKTITYSVNNYDDST